MPGIFHQAGCCCGEECAPCDCPGYPCDNCPDDTPDTYLVAFTVGGESHEVCVWQRYDDAPCQLGVAYWGDECDKQVEIYIEPGPEIYLSIWQSGGPSYLESKVVDCCCAAADFPDDANYTNVSITPCCDPEACEAPGSGKPCTECCGTSQPNAVITIDAPDGGGCGNAGWENICNYSEGAWGFEGCTGNYPATGDCEWRWANTTNPCPAGWNCGAGSHGHLTIYWDKSEGKYYAAAPGGSCLGCVTGDFCWEFGDGAGGFKDITADIGCNPKTGHLEGTFTLQSQACLGCTNPCPDCEMTVSLG